MTVPSKLPWMPARQADSVPLRLRRLGGLRGLGGHGRRWGDDRERHRPRAGRGGRDAEQDPAERGEGNARAQAPGGRGPLRIENHVKSPFELTALDHGQGQRWRPRFDTQRLGDLEQMPGIGGGPVAEIEHGFVAGFFARSARPAGGRADHRVEPVESASEAPEEVAEHVDPQHVHELMLQDHPLPLHRPGKGR